MNTYGIYRLPGPVANARRAHPRPRRIATVQASSAKLALIDHDYGLRTHPQYGGATLHWRGVNSSRVWYHDDDGKDNSAREWQLVVRLNNGARAFHDQRLVAWKDPA